MNMVSKVVSNVGFGYLKLKFSWAQIKHENDLAKKLKIVNPYQSIFQGMISETIIAVAFFKLCYFDLQQSFFMLERKSRVLTL